MGQYKEIAVNGLWKQNTGVVQLLGLCPTLAVSTSLVNGTSLGLATAIVMACANGAVSPVRKVARNQDGHQFQLPAKLPSLLQSFLCCL